MRPSPSTRIVAPRLLLSAWSTAAPEPALAAVEPVDAAVVELLLLLPQAARASAAAKGIRAIGIRRDSVRGTCNLLVVLGALPVIRARHPRGLGRRRAIPAT